MLQNVAKTVAKTSSQASHKDIIEHGSKNPIKNASNSGWAILLNSYLIQYTMCLIRVKWNFVTLGISNKPIKSGLQPIVRSVARMRLGHRRCCLDLSISSNQFFSSRSVSVDDSRWGRRSYRSVPWRAFCLWLRLSKGDIQLYEPKDEDIISHEQTICTLPVKQARQEVGSQVWAWTEWVRCHLKMNFFSTKH